MRNLTSHLDRPLSRAVLLVTLFAVAFIFYYPVISADVKFQDDVSRDISVTNSHGFQIHGRFMAELVSHIMSGSSGHLVDYGNLGQILGLVLITLSVYGLVRHKLNSSVRSFFFALPLIANPFLLHNISYQYDALGMLAGYALAIAAYTVFRPTKKGFIATSLLLYTSLGFYQAMPSVYLSLLVIFLIIDLYDKKIGLQSHLYKFAYGCLAYLAAVVMYVFTTKFVFLALSGRDAYSLSSDSIIKNFNRFIEVVVNFFNGPIGLVMAFAFLIAIGALGTLIYKYRLNTYRTILIICLLLFVLPVTIIGPLLFVVDAIIFPRSLPSITAIMLVSALVLLVGKDRIPILQLVSAATITLLFVISLQFSFVYGAFMKNQDNYRGTIVNSIYSAIQINEIEGEFYLTGSSNSPVVSSNAMKRYPTLKDYWGSSAINSPNWGKRLLRNYNIPVVVDWNTDYPELKTAICSEDESTLIVDGQNFAIYKVPGATPDKYLIQQRASPFVDYCSGADNT